VVGGIIAVFVDSSFVNVEAAESVVVEDSVSVVIEDDTVFELVTAVKSSVEASVVLEDTVDVESVVGEGVVVKVTAVHF